MNTNEHYLYLGRISDVVIFVHNIRDTSRYTYQVSSKVFSCCVAEELIEPQQHCVIVFEFFQEQKIIVPLILSHVESPTINRTFSTLYLKHVLLTMFKVERLWGFDNPSPDYDVLIIEYDHTDKTYSVVTIPTNRMPRLQPLDESTVNIADPTYVGLGCVLVK